MNFLYQKWPLWIRIVLIPVRFVLMLSYALTFFLPILLVDQDVACGIWEIITESGNKTVSDF